MDTPHQQTQTADSGSPLKVYKPGQAPYVRWGTAVGAGVVAIAGALFFKDQLLLVPGVRDSDIAKTLMPLGLIVALAWVIFYYVGQHRGVVDFMIATEGEMKKVNWSSRREVIGATKVVIFSVLALGFFLFIIDVAFVVLFSAMDVLQLNVLEQLFGGGGER